MSGDCTKPDPLIVVGASTRAAAFSAVRAGFMPICADLFGDIDLAACCRVCRVPPGRYPDALVEITDRMPPGPWMFTGAIENRPDLIARIAQRRPLWGNDAGVIRRVRDPFAVQACLSKAGLAHPEVEPCPAKLPHDGSWLVKPRRGAGGRGIAPFVGQLTRTGEPVFYQRRIHGEPASAIFVGGRDGASLVGVTRQLIGEPILGARPFAYCGSIGPLPADGRLNEPLATVGQTLASHFGLRGLFGIDCVVRDGVPWPIEVNPRYTASVEVIERATGWRTISLHQAACTGGAWSASSGPALWSRLRRVSEVQQPVSPGVGWLDEPNGLFGDDPTCMIGKAILFAPEDVVVPKLAAGREEVCGNAWPLLADIPAPGRVIRRGHPLITVFAHAAHISECRVLLLARAREILAACQPAGAAKTFGVR